MRNVVFKAAAVLAASVVAVFIVGCDDVTGPATEFGNAELIYEYVSDSVLYFYLADVSADGDAYLIWACISSTLDPALFLLEPETNDLKLVYSGSEWGFYEPKLSPDKQNVFFSELSGIYVVPVAGGDPRLVYGSGLAPTPVQWLDEDTVLMYVIEDRWKVNRLNINTLEVETLFDLDDLELLDGVASLNIWTIYFSADEDYFVLNGMRSEEEFGPSESFSRIYDTGTLEYQEYVRGENGIDYLPDGPWSPDGTKIAISLTNTDRMHLGYFDVDTSEPIMVFSSYKLLFNPTYEVIWSADGKHFLASEYRDDNILRVFAVDVE